MHRKLAEIIGVNNGSNLNSKKSEYIKNVISHLDIIISGFVIE